MSDLPTPSVDVRWRPLVSEAVVTQLVTHPLGRSSGRHGPNTTRHVSALAMPDVVRWLVERRAPPLVMAASAGDHEVTHALARPHHECMLTRVLTNAQGWADDVIHCMSAGLGMCEGFAS
jgi:hypothetical protein